MMNTPNNVQRRFVVIRCYNTAHPHEARRRNGLPNSTWHFTMRACGQIVKINFPISRSINNLQTFFVPHELPIHRLEKEWVSERMGLILRIPVEGIPEKVGSFLLRRKPDSL